MADHCCGLLKPHAIGGQVLAAGREEVGLGAKERARTSGREGVKLRMAAGGQTAPGPAACPATVLPAGMRNMCRSTPSRWVSGLCGQPISL